MRMIQAWHRRTGPERFETYTRWTLYLLIGVVPLMAVGVAGASPAVAADAGVYVVLTFLQSAMAIAVVREGITAFRDGAPVRRGPVVLLLALTGVTAAAALITMPPATDMGWYGRGAAVFTALLAGLFGLTPILTGGVVAGLALLCAVVAAVVNLPAMDRTLVVPVAMVYAVIAVTIAPSFRISIWMLGVVWEQERTRGLHARLAVAEERLRFSRDLHDVVGRTLSAVALKSELAAGLVGRDQGAAAAQMLEVRELANDSLREVRAVVAGYRQADLASELIGARSMLRSAGVRTRVIGEDTVLPQRVQAALAWVVREGATNVVRHSSASACTIDLSVVVDDGGARLARLAITNDGVTAAASTGSGLAGLAERLAPLGGTITAGAGAGEGTFVLTATVACVEDGTAGSAVVSRAVGVDEHARFPAAGSTVDPGASAAPPVGPVAPAEGGTMDRP